MSMIKGFIMSLGMFSIIPVPKNSWNEKHMPMVIPNLPLVGMLTGLIWYGLARLLTMLGTPPLIESSIILIAPFFLTGFIHTDGYMDVADALFSRRDIEAKKKILKDSNVGAFAVVAIIGLILFQFSAIYTILDAQKTLMTLAFIPAVSRCAPGIAILTLKPIFDTGYAATFKSNAKPRHTILICVLTAMILTAAWLTLGTSALPLLAGIIMGLISTAYLYKQFQGMSGDLSGCIITVSELAALLCMALI